MRRFYQDFEHGNRSTKINLSDTAVHHLLTVLRMKEGDQLILFNGHGEAWKVQITHLIKKHGQIEFLEKIDDPRESPLHIHLAQAVSKGERMDFVMQKATELGVSEITPVLTERTNVKIDAQRWEKKFQHWKAIMANACEQCGRSTLPTLNPVVDLSTYFSHLKEDLRLILSPYATQALKVLPTPKDVTLLIGPEGGLSEAEVRLALDQYHFEAIKLGPRVLRTETAALTALSLIQFQWGDI